MRNKRDMVQAPRQSRKIGPTRRSVSGIYNFRREMSIPFESTLERDFLIRKEFCLTVLDIIPQPCQIPFQGRDGRSHTYTPDFLIYYRLGNVTYWALHGLNKLAALSICYTNSAMDTLNTRFANNDGGDDFRNCLLIWDTSKDDQSTP